MPIVNSERRAVFFSHGKESGPWGSKISSMAAVAKDLGWHVESIDYQGIDDPRLRVDKLVAAASDWSGRVVLVGSSMGGYVGELYAGRHPVSLRGRAWMVG
jgi:pimeloyl-ACP methyl ester carboxylesterase